MDNFLGEGPFGKNLMSKEIIQLNEIEYAWPKKPVVVVCIDGGDPEYIDSGIEDGIIPNIEGFLKNGFYALAKGSMPSFTCPNNMSIVTGSEPVTHGISGNFYLDRSTGEPVVMTGPELLRTYSIMSEFSRKGARVVSITAKDKLRRQLQKGMDLSGGSVSMSSQFADRCTLNENGIEDSLQFVGRPQPEMYSAELSLFVLDAGIKFLEERRPDILYLSLTDFIQHTHAPGTPVANQFYSDMDARFGRLKELDAVVALTADHGMPSEAGNAWRGRHYTNEVVSTLHDQFDPDGRRVVLFYGDPADNQIFVDTERAKELGLTLDEMAAYLETLPFISAAFTETEVAGAMMQ